MPYTNFTDRAIPYHLDGSVVKIINSSTGVLKSFSAAEMLEANDEDYFKIVLNLPRNCYTVIFFPELRNISGIFAIGHSNNGTGFILRVSSLEGSIDSTNGLDGTWTDATMPDGFPDVTMDLDSWRKGFKAVQGLNGIKVLRFKWNESQYDNYAGLYILHLYGHKTAGQTPRDLIFLDPENSDAEYAIPLDFADRPAGTSAIRQIKVKNVSSSLTANNVTVESIDPVDDIRLSDTADGPWVTSKTITSLAPNTASAIIYVKCETDAPPTPLGPMRAPIKASVGAWA